MKKVIICVLLLIIAITTFSQQSNPTPTLTKQDYLQKSKKQKTAAWVLLSGGFVLSTIGASLALDDAAASTSDALVTILTLGTVQQTTNDHDNTAVANVLFFSGLAGMVGSIPLFSAAGRNKRKGMSLSFINESAPQLQKGSFVYKSVPSLRLKINL